MFTSWNKYSLRKINIHWRRTNIQWERTNIHWRGQNLLKRINIDKINKYVKRKRIIIPTVKIKKLVDTIYIKK
jgi:hypothetical protein